MLAVLGIIILFCCLAAPGIRGLCKRFICRTCIIDDPDLDNVSRISPEDGESPTIILLPYGRMLVVDRRVVSRLQNHRDTGGMEMMEVGSGLYRPGMHRRVSQPLTIASTPSFIIDSSDTSKGVSPISLKLPPPAYGQLFPDLPPSYSEISLMMKQTGLEAFRLETIDTSDQLRDGEVTVVQMTDLNANSAESDNIFLPREPDSCSINNDNNNNVNNTIDRDNGMEDINNNNNVVIGNGHIEFVQEL